MKKWFNKNFLLQNLGSLCAVSLIFISMLILLSFYFYGNHKQNQNNSFVSPAYEITLDYYLWDDEEFYVRDMAAQFTAQYPNIKINLHILKSAEYDDSIVKILEQDPSIDLIDIRGTSQLCRYQSNGVLADITDYMKNGNVELTAYSNIYDNVMIDNKYYAFPFRSTCWVLVYNKDIFDQHGLPYPEQITWEEYQALAKTLTYQDENGVQHYGGLMVTWDPTFYATQNNHYLIDDDLTAEKNSLEMLNNFYNIDQSHVPLSLVEENDFDCIAYFGEGNVAMMPMGEWFVGSLIGDEKYKDFGVNWDLAYMPVQSGMNKGTTWGQFQYIAMTTSCSYPDAAFAFMQFVAEKKGAMILAKRGMLSAYTSNEVKELYRDTVGNKNTDVFFSSNRLPEVPVYSKYSDLQTAFKAVAKSYLHGEATIDQAMERFEQMRKNILQ